MREITAGELNQKLLAGEQLLLVDVRQPEELVHGTLNGSHLFPLSEVTGRVEELERLIADHNGEVLVFCRSGGRSEQVIRFLESRNPRELTNLKGGMNDYSQFDSAIERY